MNNLRLWHKFLETIKPQVGPDNFKAYFLKTLLKSSSEGLIVLSTPSAFIKENLNQRFGVIIKQAFEKLLGQSVRLEFIVKEVETKTEEADEDFFRPIQTSSLLNPRYTLANFVVGSSNNVAYAAAQAVVQNPGSSYNPLFLYGGTGVGKTHLMLGIGNAILAGKKRLKITYCSSEKFLNDYVTAIQERKMADFRAKSRSCDVLLIDDIQFFSGREGLQEEFFHTFNELQAKNSQMVLTSDRTPQEIAKLEDRLKSRFAGGLMIDIQSPDFDTRVAILQAKCAEQGTVLPEDSLKLIASSLESNIRELEGKLVQIIQGLKAQNLPASSEHVSKFLGRPLRKSLAINHKQLLSAICSYFNVTLKELAGPRRQKELVLPRHLAMYILSEELNFTVEKIGQVLGGRDHTTVMHGRDKIKKLVDTDIEVQKILLKVKQKAILSTN